MARPRALHIALGAVAAIVAVTSLAGGALVLGALPSGNDTDDADATAATGEPSMVFAEFGATADRIYTAPGSDPAARTLLEVVEHAQGWGLNPAPEMSGNLVAYTVLPADAVPQSDAPAELWLLDVASRDRTRLARDADLLVAPTFQQDGAGLVYRRSGQGQQELVRVDLETGARRVVHTAESRFGIFPIGFASDGALIFSRLSAGGTDVFEGRDGDTPELLFHASDYIARDWRIAPGGDRVSFLAPEERRERVVHRAYVFPLDGSSEAPIPADGEGDAPHLTESALAAVEQYGPIWTPDGQALTVGREAGNAAAEPAVLLGLNGSVTPLAAPEQGFDVPLAWSENGNYLAIRSFNGANSYAAGQESLVVISTEGERQPLSAETELIFIGWTGDA